MSIHRHDELLVSRKQRKIDMIHANSQLRGRAWQTATPSDRSLDRLQPHRPLTSRGEPQETQAHGKRTLQRARARKALAAGVERKRHVPHQGQEQEAQALPARDVPLPVRAHPHGARALLHAGRRHGPLHARQGLQCAASHGLGRLRPAGRERRHGAQGPPAQMDLREYRHHARPAQGHGPVDRLGARVRHLQSRLLRAPAAAVPGLLQEEAAPTARPPRSTGTRWRTPCSPTSR